MAGKSRKAGHVQQNSNGDLSLDCPIRRERYHQIMRIHHYPYLIYPCCQVSRHVRKLINQLCRRLPVSYLQSKIKIFQWIKGMEEWKETRVGKPLSFKPNCAKASHPGAAARQIISLRKHQ